MLFSKEEARAASRERYIENRVADIPLSSFPSRAQRIDALQAHVPDLISRSQEFYLGKKASSGRHNPVYQGCAGFAYLLWRLGDAGRALTFSQIARTQLRTPRSGATLLAGDAGPLALEFLLSEPGESGVCLSHSKSPPPSSSSLASSSSGSSSAERRAAQAAAAAAAAAAVADDVALICSLSDALAVSSTPDTAEQPNELLYGRAGAINALLLLLRHTPSPLPPDSLALLHARLVALLRGILSDGRRLGTVHGSAVHMCWVWHGKRYVGGAHGIAGILSVLLLAEPYVREHKLLPDHEHAAMVADIKATTLHLPSLAFESGNYPSSLPKTDDILVQFCHGATGPALLYCLAHDTGHFTNAEKQQLLTAAASAADVIWHRGLVNKGLSLCHGVAGNGWVFLALFCCTGSEEFMHRALCFAEFAVSPKGDALLGVPDHPFSLFEGSAGLAAFITAIRECAAHPDSSWRLFPGLDACV